MSHYTVLEHATDALVEVVAPDMSGAFEEAGRATVDMMLDRGRVDKIKTHEVRVEADSMHELLYLWLEEVIFQTVTRGFAIADMRATHDGGHAVRATVHGEELDVKKHRFGVEVKAPTYHEMLIKDADAVRMRFLLDL